MNRKPIFEVIRLLLGRGLNQREVDRIDEAFDAALNDREALPSPVAFPIAIGPAGLRLIREFEGCARRRSDGLYEAYPDPGTGGEPWTIGWGATGRDIGPGTVWTRDQCDARLLEDVARHAQDVAKVIGEAPTSQSQFDALASFHFNTGAIHRATLTKHHLSGEYEAAEAEFGRWIYAGKRVLPGLVRRREAEAALYRSHS